MRWIPLRDTIYPIDTEIEQAIAQAALANAGVSRAAVWVGDPDTTYAYPSGEILYAAARANID